MKLHHCAEHKCIYFLKINFSYKSEINDQNVVKKISKKN